jgi:polygalacturonase
MRSTPLLFLGLLLLGSSLDIEDFGAVPDDSSYRTSLRNGAALTSALIAANLGPDKTVTISAGKVYTMLPSTPVSDLVGVTIVFDGTIYAWRGYEDDWPEDANGGALSLVTLLNVEGLTITGSGVMDGQGYRWWWKTILTGKDNRPVLIDIEHAKDTLIQGITLKNGPKYHFSLMDMLNCTVRDVNIIVDVTDQRDFLSWVPTFPLNTDGIDISGRDIYFTNLYIQNFDDAIAVKPSHMNQYIYCNCTENLLIENSNVKYGVGMSIGSVPPNDNIACIRNVTFRNIQFHLPLKAIYIKPNPGTHGSGIISNIVYENIDIHEALWWAVWIGPQQQEQPGSGANTGCSFLFPLPGKQCPTDPLVTISDVVLRNVNIYGGVQSPGVLLCNSQNPCTNFLFDNVNVYGRSHFPVVEGFYCENVQGYAQNSNLYPKCFTKIGGFLEEK